MNNEQTLELQIKSKAQEAKSSIDSLLRSLTSVESTLTSINTKVGNIEKNGLKTTVTNMKQLKQATNDTSSSVNKLGNSLKSIFTFAGAKKLTMTMLGWMNESVNYTEQLNLFNVVFKNTEKNGKEMFSSLGRSATQFQYKLNEVFGTNKTETLYMQGIFQSMGETVGIGDKYSAIMSETMTKLTYDLASLYNKSEDKVAEALRAGVYAGQTKPLRGYGIDVTQTSMQPILNSLGIDKQVKELSQAEKEILRYIATLKQAKIAMGDFANNLESPSNQMKIFRQQLTETKVALTSLFIGGLAKILPYANAFLMVIKEVSKAIATMFGIKLTDYNTGIASQEGIYDGIKKSANDATDAVKALKRQVLVFDEIHNIDENKNNGSGSDVSGGIDKRLLDAIKGYDNGMDKVRMKATEIRDKIMDWLGFTKEIDPLTGEVAFKLKSGYSNLKLVGGVIATLLGYQLLKKIVGIGTAIGALGASIPVLTKSLVVVGKLAVGIAGIAGVIFGAKGTSNAMKEMTKQSKYGGEQQKKYTTSVLGTIAGATALGTVLGGPLGAAIGALSGSIIAGTSALIGYKKGMVEIAKSDLFGTISVSTSNWKDMLDGLNVSIFDNTARFETLKNNLSLLGESFDENVNKLDLYGLKFGTLSQKITEEDAVNINSAIKGMCDSANSIIDETTTYNLELWGTSFSQMSVLTDEEEKDILNSIVSYGNNQKNEIKNAQDNITATYNNAIATRGYLTDEEYRYIESQLQKIRELTNKQMSVAQTDVEYYKKVFADKNQKLDEQSYANYKTALDTYNSEKLKAIQETYNQQYNSAKAMLDNGQRNQEEFDKMIKQADEQRNQSQRNLYIELMKTTNNVVDGLKKKYDSIRDDNSKQAKEQKKIIEEILGNVQVDYSGYINAGSNAGSNFASGFRASLKGGLGSLGFSSSGSAGIRANGGIYSSGRWKDIPQYANGGAPSHGSLVFAGENGPEILGNANGKTEILNKSQIASALYSAVYSAMSQFNGGGIAEINVHASKDVIVETAINGINQQTNQTGICPVKIPVN